MISSVQSIVAFCATVIFIYMSVWFLIAMAIKRNDIVDVAWGLGFSTLAVLVPRNGQFSQDLVIRMLIIVWGVRLSYHIFARFRKKSEDYRYLAMSSAWGKWFILRSYVQVFMLQGIFMLLISAPLIVSSVSSRESQPIPYWIGLGIWVVGFIFESVGDWQLAQFISQRKNKNSVMRYGVWRYTRHPNYFGEVTQWWGIFFIVMTQSNGMYAILSPIVITILILGISGIPMLEKKYVGNTEFEAYKRTTSPFFPWIPKN